MVVPLLAQDSAPIIITQPTNQTAVLSNDWAEFDVVADDGTDDTDLNYQWYKKTSSGGSTRLTDNDCTYGSQNSSLLLGLCDGVLASDAGTYYVVVTNAVGKVTSSNATLTVVVPPTITTQPSSVTVVAGGTTNFTVKATGTAPLSYQWNLYGVPLTNATNATLTLMNVTADMDQNPYDVIVSNVAGPPYSQDSIPAILTVVVLADH